MSGLEDLYKEIILEHYKRPRNQGELPSPPALKAQGHNPLCGDEVVVYVELENDLIKDIRISGQGCSISQSSASLMSVAVKGKTLLEMDHLLKMFKSMMTISTAQAENPQETELIEYSERDLGELAALKGVVKFPVRIKCAILSWNTLVQAIGQKSN